MKKSSPDKGKPKYRQEKCKACDGTGIEPGSPFGCQSCDGLGWVPVIAGKEKKQPK